MRLDQPLRAYLGQRNVPIRAIAPQSGNYAVQLTLASYHRLRRPFVVRIGSFVSITAAGRRLKTHNWATTPGDCSLAYEYRKGVVQYRAAVAEDMAHKAVPLEPQEFLDNFLKAPCQHLLDTPPPLDGNPFEAISGAANMVESQISELFVTAVNDNQSIAHGLKMALSEKMPDVGESEGAKIDAAFFRPELLPIDGRPHWADQMVSVEFKAHGTANDPYDDREPGNDIDAHAVTRKQVRGQIIHYAEKVFEYQQRTSLIMLVIIGQDA
ncbi:hypothetical protein ACG7TL_006315 [Trametes sanguinea]